MSHLDYFYMKDDKTYVLQHFLTLLSAYSNGYRQTIAARSDVKRFLTLNRWKKMSFPYYSLVGLRTVLVILVVKKLYNGCSTGCNG